MKKHLKSIIHYARKHCCGIIGYIILRLLKTIISILIPLIYAQIITSLLNGNFSKTILIFACLCISYMVTTIVGYLSKVTESKLSKKISYEAKKETISKIYSVPYNYLGIEHGKLLSLIITDAEVIASLLFTMISVVFAAITLLNIGLIVFFINYKLAIILLCTYPINILVNKYYGKKIKDRANDYFKKRDTLLGGIKSSIDNLSDISNHSGFNIINREIDNLNNQVYDSALMQAITQVNYSTTMNAVGVFNHLLLTLAGIVFVYTKEILFGDFIAFNTYSKSVISSIDLIVNLDTMLQPSMVSLERLAHLDECYNHYLEQEKSKDLFADAVKYVRFVDLSYKSNEKEIIRDFSIEISAGDIVGICGKNGSGKTTICNLLLSNYTPTKGNIYINDTSVCDINHTSIVGKVSYVGSAKKLINISLRDNILLSNSSEKLPEETILSICEMLNLEADIKSLSKGLDTMISDSCKLSSGQIQKILIARALLREFDILILDEALSNLDNTTKSNIKQYIKKLASVGKIIIVISHIDTDYDICNKMYYLR